LSYAAHTSYRRKGADRNASCLALTSRLAGILAQSESIQMSSFASDYGRNYFDSFIKAGRAHTAERDPASPLQ